MQPCDSPVTLTSGGARFPPGEKDRTRAVHPGAAAGERQPRYHLEGPGHRTPGAAAPSDTSQTLQRHMRRREARGPSSGHRGHTRKAGPQLPIGEVVLVFPTQAPGPKCHRVREVLTP